MQAILTYVIYENLHPSVHIVTERDGRKGPPAGNKAKCNRTNTPQSKAPQLKSKPTQTPQSHRRGARQAQASAEGRARPRIGVRPAARRTRVCYCETMRTAAVVLADSSNSHDSDQCQLATNHTWHGVSLANDTSATRPCRSTHPGLWRARFDPGPVDREPCVD
jgi:hypothetical protein